MVLGDERAGQRQQVGRIAGLASDHPAARIAHVEWADAGAVAHRPRAQPPDQALEVALHARGEAPVVVDRQFHLPRVRGTVPRGFERLGLDRPAQPRLGPGPERRHDAGVVAPPGLQEAGADQAGERALRRVPEHVQQRLVRAEVHDLRVRPRPDVIGVGQFPGQAAQPGQPPPGARPQRGGVLRHHHQAQPRAQLLPGDGGAGDGGNSHGRSGRRNSTTGT